MNDEPPRIIIITGPTATGKSGAALEVAQALMERGLGAGVISADSVQVYRYMDIGTDKLAPEKRQGVPHHLIDVVNPDQCFSAAEFSRRADQIIREAWPKGKGLVVTGGTGFYLRALLQGLFPGPGADAEVRARLEEEANEEGSPALHKRLSEVDPGAARHIHPRDRVRIIRALEVFELTGEPLSAHFQRHQGGNTRYHALMIGLAVERENIYERINSRVMDMIERGLVEEVRGLRQRGYGPELKSQQALGYQQVHMILDGKIDLERAIYLIQRDTRHYARRQLTWFRKEKGLKWMPAQQREKIISRAVKFMEEGR